MISLIFLIVGIAGLVLTGYLASEKKLTLSQRAQGLFPPKVDWFIGVGGMIILAALEWWCNLNPALAILWAGFWGHIWIANKERYKA